MREKEGGGYGWEEGVPSLRQPEYICRYIYLPEITERGLLDVNLGVFRAPSKIKYSLLFPTTYRFQPQFM